MYKKFFVLLVVFSMSAIYSMELSKPLQCGMSLLSQDIAHEHIQPWLSLQEISRFKQSATWCNKLYDVEKIFNKSECSSYCNELAGNYYTCTKALGHFAKNKDEQVFQHLWAYHNKVRNDNIIEIFGRSTFTLKDQMKVYRKHYNKAERVRKNVLRCALAAINESDIASANVILLGGSLSIFDLLKKHTGLETFVKDNDIKLDIIFYHACSLGNADLIKGLCGRIIDDRSFEYIVEYANALLMFNLVDKGTLPSDGVDQSGKTVLHYAAQRGFERVIKIVLDKGAYVNCRDAKGMTPLHYAIKHVRRKAVEMLLNNPYADVRFANKKGKRAIDYGVPVNKCLLDKADTRNDKEAICKLLNAHLEKMIAHPYSYAKVHRSGYQMMHL